MNKRNWDNLFIERAEEIHSNRYDYSEFEYLGTNTKGKILCSKHGEFWQTPSNHLRGNGCPSCSRASRYENTFKAKCKELGINYWRALKRREAGLPEEKIFEKGYVRSLQEVNKITVFGIEYPNFEEAVRQLNPPANGHTIGRWIRSGMSPEEAFERIPNPGYANGIIYLVTHTESGKQYIGLTIQTLHRRWKYHLEQAAGGYIKGAESLHYAIREHGESAFELKEVDTGTTKKDLEQKEREWIAKLGTLAPNGYNLCPGGVSGGSNKKPTYVDGVRFDGVAEAARYVAQTRDITLHAAKKRILEGRIDVKAPAKPGQSLVKAKAYKAWSNIIHATLNPKSKDYIPGLDIYLPWQEFDKFLKDVGQPPNKEMVFCRLDKSRGFFPENCAWLTKSQASKINAEQMKKNGTLLGNRAKGVERRTQVDKKARKVN